MLLILAILMIDCDFYSDGTRGPLGERWYEGIKNNSLCSGPRPVYMVPVVLGKRTTVLLFNAGLLSNAEETERVWRQEQACLSPDRQ